MVRSIFYKVKKTGNWYLSSFSGKLQSDVYSSSAMAKDLEKTKLSRHGPT